MDRRRGALIPEYHGDPPTPLCADPAELYRYITTKVAAIEGVRTVETVPQLTRVKQSFFLVQNGRLRDPT